MKCRSTGRIRPQNLPLTSKEWIENIELGDLQIGLRVRQDTCRKSFHVKSVRKGCVGWTGLAKPVERVAPCL
jgi:hypothetical protein